MLRLNWQLVIEEARSVSGKLDSTTGEARDGVPSPRANSLGSGSKFLMYP